MGKQKTLVQNYNADSETDYYLTRPVAKETLPLREDDGVLMDQCTVRYFPEVLCSCMPASVVFCFQNGNAQRHDRSERGGLPLALIV